MAPAGIFSAGEARSTKGGLVSGGRGIGGRGWGAEPPPRVVGEVFKILKISMKILQFLIILIENLQILQFFANCIKFFSKIWAKILKNLEICICRGFGEGEVEPPKLGNLSVEKSTETCIFDNFNGNFAIFQNFSNFIEFVAKSLA